MNQGSADPSTNSAKLESVTTTTSPSSLSSGYSGSGFFSTLGLFLFPILPLAISLIFLVAKLINPEEVLPPSKSSGSASLSNPNHFKVGYP